MNRTRNRKIKKAMLIGAIGGLIAGVTITFAAASKALNYKEAAMAEAELKLKQENAQLQKQLEEQAAAEAAAVVVSADAEESWELAYISEKYPLDSDYVPELEEVVSGKYLDSRIVSDAKAMLAAAGAEGLDLYVVSAYRSYENQEVVFDDTVQTWLNQGYGYAQAYEKTKQSVAVPGGSEHAAGLALDIVSADYQELDDEQGDTKECQWMMENCYKYGFILRYPQDKTDITGIVYEPWHYRYVGKEAAKEIMKNNITFEEYLGLI
jgi:D-alanyl-D-alanine carboxypeptidase